MLSACIGDLGQTNPKRWPCSPEVLKMKPSSSNHCALRSNAQRPITAIKAGTLHKAVGKKIAELVSGFPLAAAYKVTTGATPDVAELTADDGQTGHVVFVRAMSHVPLSPRLDRRPDLSPNMRVVQGRSFSTPVPIRCRRQNDQCRHFIHLRI